MSELTVRTASDAQGWDNFVLQAGDPDGFLQSWMWGDFQQAVGRPIERWEVMASNRRLAVCLLVTHTTKLGKAFYLAPRGPIVDRTLDPAVQQQAWSALAAQISQQRPGQIMFLKLEPNIPPPAGFECAPGTGTHPETTLVIDLRQPPAALLEHMHHKTRYNITLARRKGVSVRWTRDTGDVDIFLHLLTQTADRQHIGIHSERYYRTMVERLGGAIEVAVADRQGVPLAAGLMIRFGSVVTYLHGASDYGQRDLMAPYAMHWETIQRAQASGAAWYDLFGIAPEGSVDHKWSGITRFKKGFGGSIRVYPGAFNVVFDRTWYLAYRFAKRVAGL